MLEQDKAELLHQMKQASLRPDVRQLSDATPTDHASHTSLAHAQHAHTKAIGYPLKTPLLYCLTARCTSFVKQLITLIIIQEHFTKIQLLLESMFLTIL